LLHEKNELFLDALQTSHPISVPVNHPDEINEIFDSISYGKGASVIRMTANFLGRTTFISGVSNYLNLHKYGNAKQVFLFEKNISEIISKEVCNRTG